MNRTRISVCLAGIALISSVASAQIRSASETRKNIEAALFKAYKEGDFPGITAAVVFPNTAVMEFAVGFSDKGKKIALKPSDRMLAGSVGKTFFAAAILKMAEAGKLDLDAPISKYVGSQPWFAGLPNASQLTLRHLMRHTSGIPDHLENEAFLKEIQQNPDKVWGHSELLKATLGQKPLFAVNGGWSYGDINFIVAALVFEAATKQDAYAYIQSQILRPLGIKKTHPSISRKLDDLVNGEMGAGPFGAAGPTLLDGMLKFNPQMEWAGGGFVSNSLDLARWARHLYTGRAFGKKWVDEMLTGVPARLGPNAKYGLGAIIRETPYGTSVGHDGWYPGYLTSMEYFPKQNIAIAVQISADSRQKVKRSSHDFVLLVGKEVLGIQQ